MLLRLAAAIAFHLSCVWKAMLQDQAPALLARIGLLILPSVPVRFASKFCHLLCIKGMFSVVIPRCADKTNCTACVESDECAWCGSQSKCVTVSEVFLEDCRGTVFDPPCPSSFVQSKATTLTIWKSCFYLKILQPIELLATCSSRKTQCLVAASSM